MNNNILRNEVVKFCRPVLTLFQSWWRIPVQIWMSREFVRRLKGEGWRYDSWKLLYSRVIEGRSQEVFIFLSFNDAKNFAEEFLKMFLTWECEKELSWDADELKVVPLQPILLPWFPETKRHTWWKCIRESTLSKKQYSRSVNLIWRVITTFKLGEREMKWIAKHLDDGNETRNEMIPSRSTLFFSC